MVEKFVNQAIGK